MQNLRTFVGPYTPTVQVIDLLGERWRARITLAPTVRDDVTGAALEAFFDRLKGQANSITLFHLRRRSPLGTLGPTSPLTWTWTSGALTWTWTGGALTWSSGDPILADDVAQLASSCVIETLPGRTLLAGDMFSMGGELKRAMATATANGSGLMTVEFQPRARNLIPAGTAIVTSAPTANFMLKPGTLNVPTVWAPDAIDGASFDLIETY